MQRDPHAPVSHSARFEFFDSLNDFLSAVQQGRRFGYRFLGTPSVKDTIEAIAVPHVEVARILVDGRGVDFAHLLQGGEEVQVFPYSNVLPEGKTVPSLQPAPPRPIRFVVDVNLGKLAAKLRLLGFDTLYRNDLEDDEIVTCSVAEQRLVLTRDVGVLKHGALQYGYWVRSTHPEQQVAEVVQRLRLVGQFQPFSRCSACNGLLHPVARAAVVGRLPADTQRYYDAFFACDNCRKLYWKGSHYRKITDWIARLTPG